MCGIVALIVRDGADMADRLDYMNAALVHRGPDEVGSMVWANDGVGLAMRRLSIIDVAEGHQPMLSEDGQTAVVFNGEIYNAAELRQELLQHGHRFHTDHSDTEVLVHGYEQWGAEMFSRLNGMFALCVWDRRRSRLVVARDRAGEKPLYVAKLKSGYAIASELKALLRHPDVPRDVDMTALEQFLSFDFILSPSTILAGVSKLPAGHYAVISQDAMHVTRYWSLRFTPRRWSLQDCVRSLDDALNSAVSSRMVADVPIGVFLSGGLDSTTVAYYMRRHSDDVHSFAIGFEEPEYDESADSQLAASSLGTHHHLEIFSEKRIQSIVPRIADILDEPMADQSIFPTFLLSQFAVKSVKVALGGDGGDELMMGYGTYKKLKVTWQADRLPRPLRRSLAGLARIAPETGPRTLVRAKHLAETLDQPPVARLLSSLGSYRGDARWILSEDLRASLADRPLGDAVHRLSNGHEPAHDAAEATIAAYIAGYLQEDILVKVDRASMATSLEVRAPFLDPDLIDFLAAVPTHWKMKGLTGKFILRRLMRGRIPDRIIDRPKHGFGVPLNKWMRSSLAPLVTDFLSSQRLASEGVFDAKRVQSLVSNHLSGTADTGQQLWPLLLFEMWRDRWLRKSETAFCPTALPA